jgi:hypothetical protein
MFVRERSRQSQQAGRDQRRCPFRRVDGGRKDGGDQVEQVTKTGKAQVAGPALHRAASDAERSP